MALEFEWDDRKAKENLRKHGVSFHEAGTVLGDPLSMTYHDPDHSLAEHRYVTIGTSLSGRVLVVTHTERGDSVRIISARRATRQERKHHEEAG
jgi:uncharacterized DUF497 family protein